MRLLAFLFMVAVMSQQSWAGYVLVAKFFSDNTNATWAGSTFGNGSGGGEFGVTFGRLDTATNMVDSYDFSSVSGLFETGTNAYRFNTFCVEKNENLSVNNGKWFKVGGNFFQGGVFQGFSGLSDLAFYGSPSSTPGVDQVSNGTKNVFDRWVNLGGSTTLGNVNNVGTTNVKTNALANRVQDAIWLNEGEITSTAPQLNTWVANNASNNAANNKVRVLNLFTMSADSQNVIDFKAWDDDTWTTSLKNNRAQDQLIFDSSLQNVPPNVPEPATFALFGMGALAAGFYRARRGSKKA